MVMGEEEDTTARTDLPGKGEGVVERLADLSRRTDTCSKASGDTAGTEKVSLIKVTLRK